MSLSKNLLCEKDPQMFVKAALAHLENSSTQDIEQRVHILTEVLAATLMRYSEESSIGLPGELTF